MNIMVFGLLSANYNISHIPIIKTCIQLSFCYTFLTSAIHVQADEWYLHWYLLSCCGIWMIEKFACINFFFLCFIQAFARIENHYFVNQGFFPKDSFLLDNVDRIRHINTTIVQVIHWINVMYLYYICVMFMDDMLNDRSCAGGKIDILFLLV